MKYQEWLWISMVLVSGYICRAQGHIDTTFIRKYPEKFAVKVFVSNNAINVTESDKDYSPNNQLNLGLGFAINNTALNIKYARGIVPLQDKNKYGKTDIRDLQVHSYMRRFIIDVFFQKYKGFFYESAGTVDLYPDFSVRQTAIEAAYFFNANKFSIKAAFEQREKQLRSVGSFVLGGGMYLHNVALDSNLSFDHARYIDNFQVGLNAGYAYSWVLNRYWLLSGMITAGGNLGNHTNLLREGKLRVYPTALARMGGAYHHTNWAVAITVLVNNKYIYGQQNEELAITTLNLELSYTRHFHLRRKKP